MEGLEFGTLYRVTEYVNPREERGLLDPSGREGSLRRVMGSSDLTEAVREGDVRCLDMWPRVDFIVAVADRVNDVFQGVVAEQTGMKLSKRGRVHWGDSLNFVEGAEDIT